MLSTETSETDAPEGPESDPDASAADVRRRRFKRLAVFGGVVLIFAAVVLPKVPREQRMRIHFGVGSSRIVRATARVATVPHSASDWDHETTWPFRNGAPPAITWPFELPNGAADVQVEVETKTEIATQDVKVDLAGVEVTVELADAMKRLP